MKHQLTGSLAMAAIVVASNILVQYPIGQWLTWGAFSYPFAFLVSDLINRFHGPAAARRVVYAGLVVGVICSFIGTQIMGEFGPLAASPSSRSMRSRACLSAWPGRMPAAWRSTFVGWP